MTTTNTRRGGRQASVWLAKGPFTQTSGNGIPRGKKIEHMVFYAIFQRYRAETARSGQSAVSLGMTSRTDWHGLSACSAELEWNKHGVVQEQQHRELDTRGSEVPSVIWYIVGKL